jgi:hypothetical protein
MESIFIRVIHEIRGFGSSFVCHALDDIATRVQYTFGQTVTRSASDLTGGTHDEWTIDVADGRRSDR